MTCCIAALADDGLVLAMDTCISAGDSKYRLHDTKHFVWGHLDVAYAGPLHYIQFLRTRPRAGYPTTPEGFQQLLWDYPPKVQEVDPDEVEFLAVDDAFDIYVVSGHGDLMLQGDYAVCGSEYGWLAMDLIYPTITRRTRANTKRHLAKALRAVAARDNTVAEPFTYLEMPFS